MHLTEYLKKSQKTYNKIKIFENDKFQKFRESRAKIVSLFGGPSVRPSVSPSVGVVNFFVVCRPNSRARLRRSSCAFGTLRNARPSASLRSEQLFSEKTKLT